MVWKKIFAGLGGRGGGVIFNQGVRTISIKGRLDKNDVEKQQKGVVTFGVRTISIKERLDKNEVEKQQTGVVTRRETMCCLLYIFLKKVNLAEVKSYEINF